MGEHMIYIIATLTIKPETRAELIAAAQECMEATRKEPGCLAYDLYESVSDASKLVFVERWESADCLEPHRKSDHVKAFGRVAAKCFDSPPKIEVITPAKLEVR
jgi:quinol monooxygenase YgiN